jgi:hypothetical protein
MHATGPFMEQNCKFISEVATINPKTKRTVQGGKLHTNALHLWNRTPEDKRNQLENNIHALLNADIEVGVDPEIMLAGVDSSVDLENKTQYHVPLEVCFCEGDSRATIVKKLTRWIHFDPIQPNYRKRPVGLEVVGWDKRLCAYFWPIPGIGYADTEAQIAPLQDGLRLLAQKLDDGKTWGTDDIVEISHQVFAWGGVPQEGVTADKVKQVMLNALHGDVACPEAPMNCGWTKVAAFATAHLEGNTGRHPQVIWDSRVSTSIIHRLDRMLGARHKIARVLFPDLGTVIGRGGTRPRALVCKWPIGYGKWSAQFAGSRVVKEIRDILKNPNEQYPPMPLPTGGTGLWTVRGVEMVLFGDGY